MNKFLCNLMILCFSVLFLTILCLLVLFSLFYLVMYLAVSFMHAFFTFLIEFVGITAKIWGVFVDCFSQAFPYVDKNKHNKIKKI